MLIVSINEAAQWAQNNGITILEDGRPWLDSFERIGSIPIAHDSGKKTVTAIEIIRFIDEISTGESLLWIHEYGIWGSLEHLDLFLGYRKSLGESAELYEKPGHIFTDKDKDTAVSILAITFYFIWGAVIVPTSGKVVIEVSHDEFIDVYVKKGIVLGQKEQEELNDLLTTLNRIAESGK